MCEGEQGRPSSGGTIAVLTPRDSLQRLPLKRELSLRLATDVHNGQTTATFNFLAAEHLNGSHVVIQYAMLHCAG
jgi:hypothetical protein